MSSLLSVYFIALFWQKMSILLGLQGHVPDFVLKHETLNCVQYSISKKALTTLLLRLLTRPDVITRSCSKVLGEAFTV